MLWLKYISQWNRIRIIIAHITSHSSSLSLHFPSALTYRRLYRLVICEHRAESTHNFRDDASLSFFISDCQAKMCIYLVLSYMKIRIISAMSDEMKMKKHNEREEERKMERANNGTICDLTKIDHRYCCSVVAGIIVVLLLLHVAVFRERGGDLWLEIARSHIGYVQTLNEIHITNKCAHTTHTAHRSNVTHLCMVPIHLPWNVCKISHSHTCTKHILPLSNDWKVFTLIQHALEQKQNFFPPKLISVGLDTFAIYLTFIRVCVCVRFLLRLLNVPEIDEHIVCTASNYHCQPFLCRPDCRLLSLAMCFFSPCSATATHRITQWNIFRCCCCCCCALKMKNELNMNRKRRNKCGRVWQQWERFLFLSRCKKSFESKTVRWLLSRLKKEKHELHQKQHQKYQYNSQQQWKNRHAVPRRCGSWN